MNEIRKMLSIEEVLKLVPFSRRTLFRMEADGRFPRGRLVADRKIWFADDIALWQETLPGSRVQPAPRRRRSRAA